MSDKDTGESIFFMKLFRRLLLAQKKVFYSIFAVSIFLLAAEAVLRVLGVGVLPQELLFDDVYKAAYEMLPGASNPWSPVAENLNENGFRGRRIEVQKRPGVIRIICVGDSTTFGLGVDVKETYSHVLEQSLISRGLNAEVFNAGIPGTNLWQQLLLFERRLLKYKPDLVILYSAPNIRPDLFHVRRAIESGRWGFKAKGILSRLHIYRAVRRYLRPPRFEDMYSQYSLPKSEASGPAVPARWIVADAKQDLARLKKLCDDSGIKLLAAGVLCRDLFVEAKRQGMRSDGGRWPAYFRSSSIGGDLVLLFPEIGIEPCRLENAFLDASYEKEIFLDDVHFNARGHLLMAGVLEECICAKNLLPWPCPASNQVAAE